jgi:23S rRNA (cytidine1920-2'-O)/16S rRNA (cytidine1409-2'-O)-methyltransferase
MKAMHKERLDILVTELGLAESRSLAQRLIMAGQVLVNGEMVVKPSEKVLPESEIRLKEKAPFVSRGGEKLEAAIQAFGFSDISGWVCADVGSSTGGFTDCLLQHGARKVFSIDVGYGQLHWSLRQNPAVVVMERTNARYVEKLDEPVQLIVIDASFISLKIFWDVFPKWFVETPGHVIALIKPQFEAGRKQSAKGEGVIRDKQVHKQVLEDVLQTAQDHGYSIHGLINSPILGPKGNREFLVHLQYPQSEKMNISTLIDELSLDDEILNIE